VLSMEVRARRASEVAFQEECLNLQDHAQDDMTPMDFWSNSKPGLTNGSQAVCQSNALARVHTCTYPYRV
jgi:hypothetical protein